jgi:hypothetical protein
MVPLAPGREAAMAVTCCGPFCWCGRQLFVRPCDDCSESRSHEVLSCISRAADMKSGGTSVACSSMVVKLNHLWEQLPTPWQCQFFAESQRHLFPLGMIIFHIRYQGCIWFHPGMPPLILSPVNALRFLSTRKDCAGFVLADSGLLVANVLST